MLIATWMRGKHREGSSKVKRFQSQVYFSHYLNYRTPFPKLIYIFLLCLKENSIVEFDFASTLWQPCGSEIMGHVEQKSSSQRKPSEHNDSYLNQSMFYYSAGEGRGNPRKRIFL